MAESTRRWRLAAVLALAAALFCGAVSKDAHSHGADDHGSAHHGLHDHAGAHGHGHSHGHAHSHSHDHGNTAGSEAPGNSDTADRDGSNRAGHAHFDVFLLFTLQFVRPEASAKLEPVAVVGPPRVPRWHFERPPKA